MIILTSRWEERKKFCEEGNKLCVNKKLYAEALKLYTEGDDLYVRWVFFLFGEKSYVNWNWNSGEIIKVEKRIAIPITELL